jgi:hypothetical protein|tara:strand:+ start:376 stop:621 length:246 start_codon:yes stop_codon:yes gene_type:complete
MVMRQFQFKPTTTRSTPAKLAILVFGIVFFLPILALAIVAGLVAVVAFGLLYCVAFVKQKVRKSSNKTTNNEGRKNVRIRR